MLIGKAAGRKFSRRHKGRARPERSRFVQSSRYLVFCLLIILAAGCSSGRVGEFRQIAEISTSYTQAVDNALIRTGHMAIQANSMEMLENRKLAAISREALHRQDQALKEFLEELVLLREQVMALADYFQAFASLAGSQAPQAFAAGLNQSAGSLASISQTLDQRLASGSGRLAGIAPTATAAAGIGELVMGKKRRRSLEAELEMRHGAISRVLELQEKLLEALMATTEEDQDFVARQSFESKVVGPFVGKDPLPCSGLWRADREAALLAGSLPAQLELAAEASRQLRSAWSKLLP